MLDVFEYFEMIMNTGFGFSHLNDRDAVYGVIGGAGEFWVPRNQLESDILVAAGVRKRHRFPFDPERKQLVLPRGL